jgi:hypothetical protein
MNRQQIIEGNVLIADYLKLRSYSDVFYIENHEYPSADSFYNNTTDCYYQKENLLYHYHWHWLEDAIDEIKKEDINFVYNESDIIQAWEQVINYILTIK